MGFVPAIVPPALFPFAAPLQTGWYIGPPSTSTAGNSKSVDYLRSSPLVVPVRCSFDRIEQEINVAGTAGALVRLGIYASDELLRPGALVLDAGTVASDSTGWKSTTVDVTLDPGLYWVTAVTQVAAATLACINSGVGIAADNQASGSVFGIRSNANSFSGALPATYPAFVRDANGPIVKLRVA